jgi:hypothetical protein
VTASLQGKKGIKLSEIGLFAGVLRTGTEASNSLISCQNVSFYYFCPVISDLKSENRISNLLYLLCF